MIEILNKIILNARPAAGKSEILHFLNSLSAAKRKKDFHLGTLRVIDDFPYLWRWFEEDDILETMNKPRLFTDKDGYFKKTYLWDLLIHLMNLEYKKFIRDYSDHDEYTVIFEFSRGSQHGGYHRAYSALSREVLDQCALMYLNVSWKESLRKNRARFNPDKPDSILEHGLPDNKLEVLYKDDDFKELKTNVGSSEYFSIQDLNMPYVIFENEDDVTTNPGDELEKRLKQGLNTLWERYLKIYPASSQ
jgi:hypothetical protein